MKALSLPLTMYGLPVLLMYLTGTVLITPLATFADIPSADLGPMGGCEDPNLAN